MWPISGFAQSPNQRAPSGPMCGSTGRKCLSVDFRRSNAVFGSDGLCRTRVPLYPPPSLLNVHRGIPLVLITQA